MLYICNVAYLCPHALVKVDRIVELLHHRVCVCAEAATPEPRFLWLLQGLRASATCEIACMQRAAIAVCQQATLASPSGKPELNKLIDSNK
jgi:hypothetical protein